MKLEIRAIGRLKSGPERIMVDDYLSRARALGASFHIKPLEEKEFDTRKYPGREDQATAMMGALPERSVLVAFDERGQDMTSSVFAKKLVSWRDGGAPCVVFFIGGADGLAESVLKAANMTLAFGRQTWPHRFVRFMLAEQIYRAVSVLAGTPYHRV